jgi:uncharacterized membrane protein
VSDPYLWLKWAHVISATVLFGTGIGTACHMWLAHRRGEVGAIAVVARNVVLADWLFTATSGVVQPVTGFAMVMLAGFDPLAGWLVTSYALYLVALGCWLPVVWLQMRVRDMAVAAAAAGTPLPGLYFRYMRLWFALGWPAFAGLVVAMAMMVFKPEIW